MASPLINLRVDAETRARWEEAASGAGYSLSEFIRACVNDHLGREAVVAAKAVAKAVPPSPAPKKPARSARSSEADSNVGARRVIASLKQDRCPVDDRAHRSGWRCPACGKTPT